MSHVSQRERTRDRKRCDGNAAVLLQGSDRLPASMLVCVYETDSQIKGLKGSD